MDAKCQRAANCASRGVSRQEARPPCANASQVLLSFSCCRLGDAGVLKVQDGWCGSPCYPLLVFSPAIRGKIFNLNRPERTSVDFLKQHVMSAAHQRNLAGSAADTEPGQLFQPEAETAVPLRKSPVDCQGIVLTDPSCWASAYNEELRLWAQHGNVCSNFTLHSYEWCLKTETLRAVSRSCEKQFVPVGAQTACQACLSDDLIKSCLRCVVRFAKKFWMAKLLRARLYGADGEETALAEDVQNTALFRMHGEQMKAVMQLKTDELQAWVRRRFSNRGGMSLNAPYEHLLAAVVQPCLQARWHAV